MKTKTLKLWASVLFVLAINLLFGQVWLENEGGTGNDVSMDVAIDALGNVYSTGNFSGAGAFGATTLTASGAKDLYLAKYDPAGNVLWAIQGGGTDGTPLVARMDENNKLEVEDNEKPYYAWNWIINRKVEKPIMYAEAGHVHNSCSNWAGHYKDVMSLGFTGAAGFNMRSGSSTSYAGGENETFLWTSTIRADNHMNGNDVTYTLASDGNY